MFYRTGTVDRASFGIVERQANIFESTRTRQQVEALKDETESFASNSGESRFCKFRDIDALKKIATAAWAIETAENRYQCGFS
ncbi:hypothetical protein FHT29_005180 [Rhizobium sp. SG741]|nr:hypothetical protein [Rhizobium sp. SG741]